MISQSLHPRIMHHMIKASINTPVLYEKYILLLYFRRSNLEKRREYKEKYTERDGANKHDNNRSRSRERNSHSRYRI